MPGFWCRVARTASQRADHAPKQAIIVTAIVLAIVQSSYSFSFSPALLHGCSVDHRSEALEKLSAHSRGPRLGCETCHVPMYPHTKLLAGSRDWLNHRVIRRLRPSVISLFAPGPTSFEDHDEELELEFEDTEVSDEDLMMLSEGDFEVVSRGDGLDSSLELASQVQASSVPPANTAQSGEGEAEYSREALEKRTVVQLKDICRELSLIKTGRKADIINRILDHVATTPAA